MRCEREALRPFHMTLRLSQSEERISAASFWAFASSSVHAAVSRAAW